MKKYDLIVLGRSKTGTTSTFDMLGRHPQISPSSIKEPIDKITIDVPYDLYFKRYFSDIKEDTKAVLDGTPNLPINEEKREMFKNIIEQKWIRKVKLIYNIRNPLDRMISNLYKITENVIINHPMGKIWFSHWFNNDGTIHEEKTMKRIHSSFLDSYFLDKTKEFTQHVHVITLNNLDMESLLNFLEIEDVKLELKTLAKTNFEIRETIYENIKSFINKNKDHLKKVFINDIRKIEGEYNVDLSNIIWGMENNE